MWQNKEHGTEALHRATLASPGHQKIHIARKWGFTKVNADEFENMVAEQQLIPDGCGVKYIPKIWPSGQVVDPVLMKALALAPPYSCPPINPTFFPKKCGIYCNGILLGHKKENVAICSNMEELGGYYITPWTVARQAPLFLGFSRQEYWSGLPFLSPGDLPNPGLLHCRQILYQLSYGISDIYE